MAYLTALHTQDSLILSAFVTVKGICWSRVLPLFSCSLSGLLHLNLFIARYVSQMLRRLQRMEQGGFVRQICNQRDVFAGIAFWQRDVDEYDA